MKRRLALSISLAVTVVAVLVPAAQASAAKTLKINSLSPTLTQAGDTHGSSGDVEGGVAYSPSKVFVFGNNGLGQYLRTDFSVNGNVAGSWGEGYGFSTDVCTRKSYTINWDGMSPSDPYEITSLTELDPTTGEATGPSITVSPSVTITPEDSDRSAVFSGCGRMVLVDGTSGNVYDILLPSGASSLAGTLDTSTSPYFADRFGSEQSFDFGVVENFGGDLWLDYPVMGNNTAEDPAQIRRMNLRTGGVQTIFSVPEGTGTDGYHYDFGDNPTFNVDPVSGTWFLNYEYGNNNDWISGQDPDVTSYDEVLASFNASISTNAETGSKPSVKKAGTPGGTSLRVKVGCGGSGKCKIKLTGKLKGGSGRIVGKKVKVKAGKKPKVKLDYSDELIDELAANGGGKIRLTARQVGGKSKTITLVVPASVTG